MNLIWGILAGAVIGWVAFRFSKVSSERGLMACLLIGAVGGGIGANLAPLFGSVDGADTQFSLFSLVASGALAAGCLIMANRFLNRGNA